jgi:hypothetical protein
MDKIEHICIYKLIQKLAHTYMEMYAICKNMLICKNIDKKGYILLLLYTKRKEQIWA